MENRKESMDKIANMLHVKNPIDWGKVTIRKIYELGGGTLLRNYYGNSLFRCLQSVYTGFSPFLCCFKIHRNKMGKRLVL